MTSSRPPLASTDSGRTLAHLPASAVLLVTADPALTHEVERYAAAAAVQLRTTADVGAAARSWTEAPAVLVGDDLASAVATRGVRRREDTYLVSLGEAGQDSFRAAVGVGAVAVLELPEAGDWLAGALADLGAQTGATTLAVVGGSGGVGASSLAAALAIRAGRHGAVTLVDLDPDGPGAQRLLGIDGDAGITWPDLAAAYGRLGAADLRAALPRVDEVSVLGWPVEHLPGERPGLDALPVAETLAAARRGSEWVVLDLPRGDPRADTAVLGRGQHEPVDQVVLVVRPTVTGVASAVRTLDRLDALRAPVGLVVRTRRGSPVTREVATALRLPVLAELAHHRRLDEHLDLGLGPVHDRRSPLAVAADAILRRWAR